MARGLVVAALVVFAAFGVGVSGAPGVAFGAAADWLTTSGNVQLEGPVGEAVRDAL
jgi:hypothetical protein